ncbi:histone acetyltransferases subunit 3-domain-containing protein [Mycena rebaudengoi]|nr:histone acetyltransferases subunit 3-domain-containing protein [Mycena rebaudengoi]
MASSCLAPFSRASSPIRSALFKSPPDGVPATDELEALHEELKALKLKTLERARKAGEDLRTIEESMRRMKEREKGKARAVKREQRDYTPLPDPNPIASIPPSSARSSLDPRRSEESKKKKNHKRKREEGSDHEQDRPRKATPPAPHTHPPKAHKSTASSSSQTASKAQSGPDFTVPAPVSLLPVRPPILPPPPPNPRVPTAVMDDFSKAKQPAQTPVHTFYAAVEPWLRPVREEDIGFLEHTADELEPYVMPRLGRHYLDVWAEQDALAAGARAGEGAGLPRDAPPETYAPPTPKWDPSTLTEPDLLTEERGHGPLTERVLSALVPMTDMTVWKGVKAAEDAMEGRPGGSGAAAARKEKMNVSDLEKRISDTMRYHGLLDLPPDYSEKVDDPIATALRHAQRELRTVVATNKARKARLAGIARDRLGYQEYVELRDSIDRNIMNTYAKLQKKGEPKAKKSASKLKGGSMSAKGTPVPDAGAGANGGVAPPPVPPPCPAALGLGPDTDNKLVVSEQLRTLVATRREWVDKVGGLFEAKQKERPGSMWGFPVSKTAEGAGAMIPAPPTKGGGSVFEGVDEEVRAMLLLGERGQQGAGDEERTTMTGNSSKGKGRDQGDKMDVG